MIRLFRPALTVLALSACDAPPSSLASAGDNASVKLFPPPPGLAAVYIVRPHRPDADIALGQRQLGSLGEGRWMRLDVSPGEYNLRCRTIASKDAGGTMTIKLAAGQTAYLAATSQPRRDSSCLVGYEASAKAQASILAGSRVQVSGGQRQLNREPGGVPAISPWR